MTIYFTFSDVTHVAANGLKYWCEWPMQQGKFVESTECIEKWPRIVQTFLESKIQEVVEADRPGIEKRVCTLHSFMNNMNLYNT